MHGDFSKNYLGIVQNELSINIKQYTIYRQQK